MKKNQTTTLDLSKIGVYNKNLIPTLMPCDVDIDTSDEIVESGYYRSYIILHVPLP